MVVNVKALSRERPISANQGMLGAGSQIRSYCTHKCIVASIPSIPSIPPASFYHFGDSICRQLRESLQTPFVNVGTGVNGGAA